MLMFIEVVICLAVVLCSANAHFATVKNPFLAKGWHDMRVVESKFQSGQTAPSFLLNSKYRDAATCGGAADIIFGTGFEVCLVGTDSNGKVVGSKFDTVVSHVAGFLKFNEFMYTSTDCTGASISSQMTVPTKCFASDDGYGYIYSYVNATSMNWGTGMLNQNFDTSASCSEENGIAGVLAWYGVNNCVETDGAHAMKVTACDQSGAGAVTIEQYGDANCETLTNTINAPLPKCYQATSHEGSSEDIHFDNYETMVCVK